MTLYYTLIDIVGWWHFIVLMTLDDQIGRWHMIYCWSLFMGYLPNIAWVYDISRPCWLVTLYYTLTDLVSWWHFIVHWLTSLVDDTIYVLVTLDDLIGRWHTYCWSLFLDYLSMVGCSQDCIDHHSSCNISCTLAVWPPQKYSFPKKWSHLRTMNPRQCILLGLYTVGEQLVVLLEILRLTW